VTDTTLAENLDRVRAAISAAAARAERDPQAIRLVAVTKTVPVARIRDAIALGLRTFGENRVQEAVPKIDALAAERCEWHLIGHLQRNKVKDVPGHFAMVQSVDSVRLAEALGLRVRTSLDVLIEVNVGEEPQKTGAVPADVPSIAEAVDRNPALRLRGLMTIAPLQPDPESVRPFFRQLRLLRDQLQDQIGRSLPELSMGMSDDYPAAIGEGATMLRLGRAIFGPR
jgi:pyridoxal phosphate enzyme (YggS family)